jgi:hypothetical protein
MRRASCVCTLVENWNCDLCSLAEMTMEMAASSI